MRGEEPKPTDRGLPIGGSEAVDAPKQLGEVRLRPKVESVAAPPLGRDVAKAWLGLEIVAIAVDVLPEKGHLLVAGLRKAARLVDDLVEPPAPFRPPAERDDAVGARLVTAVDDRQPGADLRASPDKALFDRRRPARREMIGDPDQRSADDGGGAGPQRGNPDRRRCQ